MSQSFINQPDPNKTMSAMTNEAIASAINKNEQPETREALEKLIEEKITKGEISCGLYDTGICFVTATLDEADGDTVRFQWFDHALNINNYIEE